MKVVTCGKCGTKFSWGSDALFGGSPAFSGLTYKCADCARELAEQERHEEHEREEERRHRERMNSGELRRGDGSGGSGSIYVNNNLYDLALNFTLAVFYPYFMCWLTIFVLSITGHHSPQITDIYPGWAMYIPAFNFLALIAFYCAVWWHFGFWWGAGLGILVVGFPFFIMKYRPFQQLGYH